MAFPTPRRVIRRVHLSVLRRLLSQTTKAVLRDKLTYLSPARLRRLESALQQIKARNIPGDIVEFGIALGGSTIILAKAASANGRNFHGFDVFGMIPAPTSEKDDAKAKQRYETIASGKSEGLGGEEYYGYRPDLYGDVCRSLARHGVEVDGSTVALHKGLFEDTVPNAPIGTISLAHIDCDWYDPVLYCLTAVADRISPGGMIIIDDYNDYSGCRAATDEFVRRRPDFRFESGENVVLRRVQ